MRRYKGTFDIFFGIEHRLRKEAERQRKHGDLRRVQQESMEETAGDEDHKHTLGKVVVAIDRNLRAEGAIVSIP